VVVVVVVAAAIVVAVAAAIAVKEDPISFRQLQLPFGLQGVGYATRITQKQP
jgi:hypothetical protein